MAADPIKPPTNAAIRLGLQISAYSLSWTIAAGSAAIVIGIIGNSLTLAVFGAIGLLDAVGSATLILHFRHALRHETVSERSERLTLLVVSTGMAAIGLATIAESIYRLNGRVGGRPVASGVALSAVSVVALTVLAVRKRRIAPRVPSRALHADGWLSGMGALLACVALLGTTFDEAFSWWWVDSAAAIAVACGALALSVVLVRDAGGEARSFD